KNSSSLRKGLIFALFAAMAVPVHSQTLVQKVLFFDDGDILYRSGTKRALFGLQKYDPTPGMVVDPVVKPDSWDSNTPFRLGSVSFDSNRNPKYMTWYQVDSSHRAFAGDDRRYNSVIAYAYSNNGLSWTKPNLYSSTGFRYPVGMGQNNNNIVLIGAGSPEGN